MEDKLLEMMNKECFNLYMGFKNRKRVAKEMTALAHNHYMEFIEWIWITGLGNVTDLNFKNPQCYFIGEKNKILYTKDELYQYWLNNEKEKVTSET